MPTETIGASGEDAPPAAAQAVPDSVLTMPPDDPVTSPLVASVEPGASDEDAGQGLGVHDGETVARANHLSSPLTNGPGSPFILLSPSQLRLSGTTTCPNSPSAPPQTVAAPAVHDPIQLPASPAQHNRSSLAGITEPNCEEVDDPVLTAIKELEDAEPVAGTNPDASPDGSSRFWTYVLAIPIIFIHGIATRMQFMYGGLYGRDGLGLSNAAAILAVGCTAAGRATAPPAAAAVFQQPLFLHVPEFNHTAWVRCHGLHSLCWGTGEI